VLKFVCVCVKQLCVRRGDKVVYDKAVCVKESCVTRLCLKELCVKYLCVCDKVWNGFV
jgi:hypothetical protein